MNKFFTVLLLLPFCALSQSGPIQIHLKTGDVVNTRFVYLVNAAGISRPYARIGSMKGEKIGIDQIAYIDGKDQYGVSRYFKPIRYQVNDLWGERTFQSDRIEIYYIDVEGDWDATYKAKFFRYSKDSSELKKLKYSFLKVDIGENAESAVYLKKGNSIRIAQLLMYTVGSALLVTGLSQEISSGPNSKISPTLVAGAVVLAIPIYLHDSKQRNFVKGLKVYK